jgi:outer membrane receptor protein involved in Fe transport
MLRSNVRSCHLVVVSTLALPLSALAGGVPTTVIDEVIVTGQLDRLQGTPISASQGVVTDEQLELRPVLRTGELMEVVPGLIVTQHSGDGKANQFFLRGFNLDHGTDLATSVGGVPVNMPTHGHGQGYTDINFVIPELVQSIEYRKGTYYAETGNFSAAGAVNMRYRRKVDGPLFVAEGGQDDFRRALLAASPELAGGTLLLGLEYAQIDGPWVLEENYDKRNAVLRYSRESRGGGQFSITAQAYKGDWRSTDQIPLRAVRSGELDRFGFIDPTSGGSSHRYTLAADWSGSLGAGTASGLLYAVDYDLDLISNFSYFTDREKGDQFEQVDDRRIYGGEWQWQRAFDWAGREQAFAAGAQIRHDDIGKVGLYRTIVRERFDTVREDAVQQTSYAVFSSLDTRWTDRVRTTVGLRADRFNFAVDANLAVNSGSASDSLVSPKLAVVLGPWNKTEFFFDIGRGFHSNDARGTTITVDPADGVTPAERVDPLVRAMGKDVGLRTALLPNTQFSVTLWSLDLDSELLFVGDAGTTEASRESERFSDDDPAGERIPGAVENVASLGVAVDHPSGWFGGARFRHFGKAPLIEDNTVRSEPTTLVNIEAGYRFAKRYKLSAAIYNVFDSDDSDITYFYESQLANETEPVGDIHFHPVEPRTLRVTLTGSF